MAKNTDLVRKTLGVRVPIPAGVFSAPKNTLQGFYRTKNCVFVWKTLGVRVPIPAGAFYAPQNTPQVFFRSKKGPSKATQKI